MGAIVVAVLAADQVSKSLVLGAHPGRRRRPRLDLRPPGPQHRGERRPRVRVPGARHRWRRIAITALAAGLALRASGRVVALSLAAVLGGAAGNLADRLFRAPGFGRGGVVDWIHFGGSGGSMDVADIAIQLGVLGAVIALLAGERARKTRQAREPR